MNWASLQRRVGGTWLPMRWHALQVRKARSRRLSVPEHHAASRRLFVDVSVIAAHDAGTGIQRVVRSIALSLVSNPPPGWQVVPVAANKRLSYQPCDWPQTRNAKTNGTLDAQAGDVFLGLDFALDAVFRHRRQLRGLSHKGVRMWFVMYDLLPASRPDWFSDALVVRYRKWLRTITGLADGFQCISPFVSSRLHHLLQEHFRIGTVQMPAFSVMPMGWDLQHAPGSCGISDHFHQLHEHLIGRKKILMVGTLEPRKGHVDALNAFELLNQQCPGEYALVIVGRPGWKTEALQSRLRQHPEGQRTVFWLDQATDEEVARLYQSCEGVLVASHAEGFGLPVIEALGQGKPVLARDIPVFHTLSSPNLQYFPAQSTAPELALCMRRWLDGSCVQSALASRPVLPTWHEAARALVASISEPI